MREKLDQINKNFTCVRAGWYEDSHLYAYLLDLIDATKLPVSKEEAKKVNLKIIKLMEATAKNTLNFQYEGKWTI